ncbi:hypothetical protein A5626_01710 [Mycobacterium marseillense]|uniref:hypothetical protein n=1 Tax=Mycobacterium marseillense TaxID=701042 RepID=UPI000800D809|nr:hypothetical protein [Mycobacterium marseillense]MCA2265184.1 hypothetical protein [Mycobacterium marseillense]OBJ75025.1 hypothetical protein A5626_01710 [Mycobacterium marseillense]
MTIPPPLDSRPTPPEFHRFADVVTQFAEATDSLLHEELSHPFKIGSEALRDYAAHSEYPGTQSKQTLLTLATQQVAVGFEQTDLLRGVAAVLRADTVTLAPFPLARTSAVIAAKAWYVLTADSREERLRRFLNEELAALYDLPLPSDEEEAATFRNDRTADYLAVGATAGLKPVYRKNTRLWDAPFLARTDQRKSEAPPSETQLMKDFYRASGVHEDDLARMPYSLLSAGTHGRFRQAGFIGYAPVGPSVGGVSTAAMHVTLEVTAQATIYAAWATGTYLHALARYTSVPAEVVLDGLRQPATDWLAIAHPEMFTSEAPSSHDGDGAQFTR